MAQYLVTGATGFLGRHVVRSLEARGHTVVRFARGLGGDIRDGQSVRAAAAGCQGAFHCAGKVSRRVEDAEELYRTHVEGTKNLLAACESEGLSRVVLASSSGTVAVGESPGHIATEADAAPIGILSRWPYYRAKLFAERAALERSRPGFEVVSVNPSLLLGPGDLQGSSTGDVRLLLEGAVSVVPAGGLSFVDARDAAEAMCLAMDRGRGGERYLVGACNCTLRDFFGRIARVAGVPAPWVPLPRSRELARAAALVAGRVAARLGGRAPIDPIGAEMAQCFWYLDSSKAERELGWRARDPSATLYDTVQDLRSRDVVWPRQAS